MFRSKMPPRRSRNGRGDTVYVGIGLCRNRNGSIQLFLPTASGNLQITEKKHGRLHKELTALFDSVPQEA